MSADGFQITIPGQLNSYSVTTDPWYRNFRNCFTVQVPLSFLCRTKVKGHAANRTVPGLKVIDPCVPPCVLGTIWSFIPIAVVYLVYFCDAWLFADAF